MEKRTPLMNRRLVMAADANHFSVVELNPYSSETIQPDRQRASRELDLIADTLQEAGVEKIFRYEMPEGCQDSIYAANMVFCDNDTAIMGRLPNARQNEHEFAERLFQNEELLGEFAKTNIIIPPHERYSGQGDTLVCGDLMFVGSGFRTDPQMVGFLENQFSHKYEVVGVRTEPLRDEHDVPMINELSGWPESEYYDIDIPMAILKPRFRARQRGLIGWCPEAFTPESQAKIRSIKGLDLIEIAREEVVGAMGGNLVSTGHAAVLREGAPDFVKKIREHKMGTYTLDLVEIPKGGGSARCVTNSV